MWSFVVICFILVPVECMAAGRIRRDYNEMLCGPLAYYRQPTGILTNNLYPNPYMPSSACGYIMRAPHQGLYNMHLKVCEVDLECGEGGYPIDRLRVSFGPDELASLCSLPDDRSIVLSNISLDYVPRIYFNSNYQISGKGFKIAYCFDDNDGISLTCSQRKDFSCDGNNYDYIRYQNRDLSIYYNWTEVSSVEATDPPFTDGTVTVQPGGGEAPSGVVGNPDLQQYMQDLLHIYDSVKSDVRESWNAQNAVVDGLTHVISAGNKSGQK